MARRMPPTTTPGATTPSARRSWTSSWTASVSWPTSALIRKLPDPVKNQVNNLLANGVVAPGVVVGGVLLAIDQLFRMEELTISSNSGLVNDRWFQVNEDSSWNMFPCSCLREEGGEGVVSKGFIRRHGSIRLDAMFQTVEFPARVTNLDSSLTNMN